MVNLYPMQLLRIGDSLRCDRLGACRRARSRCARCACGRAPRARRSCSSSRAHAKHSLLTAEESGPCRARRGRCAPRGRRARAPPAAGVVKEVRMARRPSGELRVVHRSRPRPSARRAFSRTPNDRCGYRLVVDLAAAIGAVAASRQRPSRRSTRRPRPAISSSPSTPVTAARIPAPSACTARARRT